MPLNQIEIQSANKLGNLPGYASISKNNNSGLVVLQEWWGVNENIKHLAEQWFADKFSVLVPDLYRGKVAIDHETAGHYAHDLDWQGAVQDIQGSVDYLRSLGVEKIGVIGFCMGGALALAASVLVENLNAAVPFYGISDMSDPGLAKIPLQLHFGTKDSLKGFSDSEAQEKLENRLKETNRIHEFYRYEGAEHAFANETNVKNYNKEYADLAHQRSLKFFEKYLN